MTTATCVAPRLASTHTSTLPVRLVLAIPGAWRAEQISGQGVNL